MRPVVISAAVAFFIDQISKYLVVHGLDLALRGEIELLPPLLNFRYGENRGVNFGLGDGIGQAGLIVLAVAICVGVVFWLSRRPQPLAARLSAGLLVGGALGNVFDRLVYGYVLDFLNMSCCGIDNPFVFNVADIFIFAGAFGLVFLAQDGADGENRA